MGDPDLAGQFLNEHLPGELTQLLAPELPEPVPNSYVDEELSQHHCDLVFRVHLKGGTAAFVYVLFEHKSSPGAATRLQLQRYIVQILTKWYKEHEQTPLPLVIPVVAHHGEDGWGLCTEFIEIFGTFPDPLRPYLTSFRHALVDLAAYEGDVISVNPRLNAFLVALKYAVREDLQQHLGAILVRGLTRAELGTMIRYIMTSPAKISREAIRATLESLNNEEGKTAMITFEKEFEDEYLEKGRAEGFQKGQSTLLMSLLEQRFTSISAADRERVINADIPTIECWFKRALEAPDLACVFEMKGG